MTLLRAPEDGTGAAAPAAVATPAPGAAVAPAKDPGAAAAPAATPSPQGVAAAAGYRPDGLPDHLYGSNDQDTLNKLFKAYDGSRQTIAQRGEVPKDPAGYQFEPVEAVKPYAAALDNDPFWGKVKGFAHQAGLPTKAFNAFMNGVMGEMIASELVAEPFNADKERAALVPSEQDPAKRSVEADRIVRENIERVKSWGAQGLPADVQTYLLSGMDRAAVNRLVGWIAGNRTEQAPALPGVTAAPGAVTQMALDVRQRDPRNQINSPKYDPAYAAETTALYKQLYPESRG